MSGFSNKWFRNDWSRNTNLFWFWLAAIMSALTALDFFYVGLQQDFTLEFSLWRKLPLAAVFAVIAIGFRHAARFAVLAKE